MSSEIGHRLMARDLVPGSMVIIVPFWPWPGEDRYERAIAAKRYAHAAHLRDGSVRVKRQA